MPGGATIYNHRETRVFTFSVQVGTPRTESQPAPILQENGWPNASLAVRPSVCPPVIERALKYDCTQRTSILSPFLVLAASPQKGTFRLQRKSECHFISKLCCRGVIRADEPTNERTNGCGLSGTKDGPLTVLCVNASMRQIVQI